MSGTSVDGIDVALIDDDPLRLLASDYMAFDPSLRSKLLALIQNKALTAMEMARLDADLGQAYSHAILAFMDKHQLSPRSIQAIGLHGQTIAHLPDNTPSNSWQLGHPAWVAAQTGIAVISDFRRTDMAHGGQGAPLAPALHEALFKKQGQSIAVLNLGGIANLTIINQQLIGFDVGPANCLLDEWCYLHTGNDYDHNGEWAKSGQLSSQLLTAMLADPYFQQAPPKSTGREYFNQQWLNKQRRDLSLSAADVQATLAALVVASVDQALSHSKPAPEQLIVVGGGVHNRLLMECLKKTLDCQVISSVEKGLSPDDIEAMLMAWLAARHCRGQKTDLQSVTGCRQAHVYGIRYDA